MPDGRLSPTDTKPWVYYKNYRPNANASGLRRESFGERDSTETFDERTLRERPYKHTQPMVPDAISLSFSIAQPIPD